jgi:adenine-specific DNA-methyltransferase
MKSGGWKVAVSEFLAYVRGARSRILDEHDGPFAFCSALATNTVRFKTAESAQSLLPESRDLRDYAISTAYALLIGSERRKRLSAYFTPPALADAAVHAAAALLANRDSRRTLDPACGGGSFLGPMLRFLVARERDGGWSTDEACRRVLTGLCGIEIDPDLARLSGLLLRERLREEYGYVQPESATTVIQGNSLNIGLDGVFDVVVGNPPYGKVGRSVDPATLARAGLAGIGGHTNVYGLFLLRALDWLKPGGGLVFILPTSFVAGPYFSGLRQEVLSRAEVLSIDLHEQRENLFVGAVQDVCLLVLRRRAAGLRTVRSEERYELGFINAAGSRQSLGSACTASGGEPWTLPVPGMVSRSSPRSRKDDQLYTLLDYGYRLRVGKVVPTRERDRLADRRVKGSLPLVWASDVRPDGTFQFKGTQRKGASAWYVPPVSDVAYATRAPCVLVQRTSNREQRRRLNAAPVSVDFLRQHAKRGFVAENHVIVVEAVSARPAVSPEVLALILNAASTNERFSAVSGSFSISAKLLVRLALPAPACLPNTDSSTFSDELRTAFETVPSLLAPSKPASDPENALDQACDLSGSTTVDEDAGFKRRAVA